MWRLKHLEKRDPQYKLYCDLVDSHAYTAADAGYQIARSLRFDSVSASRVSRTFNNTPTDTKKGTISLWIKRTKLSVANQYIIDCFDNVTSDACKFLFNATDQIIFDIGGGAGARLTTTASFRDTTAWMHIVMGWDTTQATAADRLTLEVNGVAQATTGTPPALNATGGWWKNSGAGGCNFGSLWNGTGAIGDYYIAEAHLIDGTKYAATTFGQFTSGLWGPKQPTSIAYGANGSYLSFVNNSSTTTLGHDDAGGAAGSGAGSNDWTLTNFSVAAGAGNDSLVDSPTNYGTDTGLGGEVRGNYCTINVISHAVKPTISNGNLDFTSQGGVWNYAIGTLPMIAGKWYWELTVSAFNNEDEVMPGICRLPDCTITANQNLGTDAHAWSIYHANASTAINKRTGNVDTALTSTGNLTVNDVLMFAYDAATGSFWAGRNGTWYNSGNPATGANALFTGITGEIYPACSAYSGSDTAQYNFGQRPFAHTAPSGFKTVCTQNMADPSVPVPATVVTTNLRLGTGAAASIAIEPNLYIGKARTGTHDWSFYDTVRGVQKQVEINTLTAETTEAQGVTAFGAGSISIGTLAQLNTNAVPYIDYSIREGSHLDIVTYTGTGVARTVSHGGGAVPTLIMIYDLTSGGSHRTYHAKMDATPQNGVLYPDTSLAYGADATIWNNTAPTSSVFTVGTDARVNTNGNSYVAYVFYDVPQLSKFGKYIGNNSADGPYVPLNFRPVFFTIKRVDSTGEWHVFDSARSPGNPNDDYLAFQSNGAEVTAHATVLCDFLANGVKIRGTNANINASGGTYVFLAFAERPAKYARAK